MIFIYRSRSNGRRKADSGALKEAMSFFDGLKQREYRGKHRTVTIIYSS